MCVAKKPILRRLLGVIGLSGVPGRTSHWNLFANPEYLYPQEMERPSVLFWVRVLVWETRSLFWRIRFARKRASSPKQTVLPFLCQSCAAMGVHFCDRNVGNYTLHIEDLQELCPWIGWTDMLVIADTWGAALDRACCNLGSARTLRHAD